SARYRWIHRRSGRRARSPRRAVCGPRGSRRAPWPRACAPRASASARSPPAGYRGCPAAPETSSVLPFGRRARRRLAPLADRMDPHVLREEHGERHRREVDRPISDIAAAAGREPLIQLVHPAHEPAEDDRAQGPEHSPLPADRETKRPPEKKPEERILGQVLELVHVRKEHRDVASGNGG